MFNSATLRQQTLDIQRIDMTNFCIIVNGSSNGHIVSVRTGLKLK